TLFSQMKSLVQMALLDGDESYERKTLDLGGVAPVLETFMTWISGAADIPVTRLFGTSAKGLNATGEGDMNNYNNSIRSKQLTQVDPGLRQLDEVLVRSALGYWPDDFNYVWNPLAQPNELQIAQAAKTRADKDMLYLAEGVITVSQVQRNLEAAEEYQFEDGQIDEQSETEKEMSTVQRPEPDEQTADAFWIRYNRYVADGLSHDEIMEKLAQ
ncbi:DUF1073 domain-containing protein, partial [Staphylococcus haemolyticus]|uniref:anti-CBASS protein Acb1 family protein n=1 Tax=Staphylococcus haemolyticus TaxID=1283 RepID=UPI001D150877